MKILPFVSLLAAQATAVNIQCYFQDIGFVIIGTAYSCEAVPTLTGSTNIESVTGNHQTGYSNDNVQALRILTQIMPFFPGGIADHFKNLKFIAIFNSNLMTISASDLRPFPQLEMLWLEENNLVNIDGDLFSFNPRLKLIHLSSNGISRIGHDLITHLDELIHLSLFNNNCISRTAVTRADVLELAPQLSILCPPLDATTTISSTITTLSTTSTQSSTTSTTNPEEETCTCLEEIDHLYSLNQVLSSELNDLKESTTTEIAALQESNVILEKRMLEVEAKLREMTSMPCVN